MSLDNENARLCVQAVDKVKKSTAFSFQMKEYMVLYPLSWMTSFQVRKL